MSLSTSTLSTPGSRCDRSHVFLIRQATGIKQESHVSGPHIYYINRSQDATSKSVLLATAHPVPTGAEEQLGHFYPADMRLRGSGTDGAVSGL